MVCIGTAAGFCTHNYLKGKTVSNVNDNGETILNYKDKAEILENIVDKNGKLVVLEIVPFKNAGVMDMLVGTDKVIDKLEAEKINLYNTYSSGRYTNGTVTTAIINGKIASQHPFTVSYDSSTKKYTLNYPNSFLNTIVDAATYPAIYNYLSDNIEVRTVVAGELKESDLNGVSLVYISSFLENTEVVSFNRFINGEITAANTIKDQNSAASGAFKKNGTAYKTSEANRVWYTDYVKNSSGTLISSDMEWAMVEKVVNYVYAGNAYTDGQPIPCIVNYGNPVNKNTNVFKLTTLLMKTTNETDTTFDGMPTYYRTVMNSITATGKNTNGRTTGTFNYNGSSYNDWSDTSVPLFNLQCTSTSDYVFNFVYKTNNSGNDSVFGMGSINSVVITDAGSAHLRGIVGDDTDKYVPAKAFGYLLGFKGAGDKKTVRVLEIEPCRDFMYDYSLATSDSAKKEVFNNILTLGQALNMPEYRADKMKSYGDYEALSDKRFSFKCVSTAEFNGMNEDLVAYYDIIIMGSEIGTMVTSSTTKLPIYNDSSLDGYIYLAYGDLVKYDDRMAGALPSEYFCIDGYTINKNGFKLDDNNNSTTINWKGQKTIYSNWNEKVWSPLIANTLGGRYYVLRSINDKFSGYTNATSFYNDSLGNARLSGNDITKKKLEELLEFVNIGRPVIMSDNLYKCVSSSNKTAYPTSKVYSFVEQKASNTNVISKNNISDNLMGIMHGNTLKIVDYTMMYNKGGVMTKAPEIAYIQNDVVNAKGQIIEHSKGRIDPKCVVEGVSEFEYTVNFRANPGTKYYVKLIVDKNTDGRFKSEATVDDFNEVYYARIVEATSNNVNAKLKIKLADNYNGMFTWQILIEELDARKNVVDVVSVDGHTVVSGEQKVVKVLQLIPTTSCNLDMAKNDAFKQLMNKSMDTINYNIQIDTMLVGDFENKFKASNKYVRGESYGTSADYLLSNEYSMLVIGFSDSYSKEDISDDNGALSCVIDFINNGNSVLFSHDTMEFQPSANAGIKADKQRDGSYTINTTSEWGERAAYIMTNGMRDLVGMDRYGVTSIKSLNDVAELEKNNIPKNAAGSYIGEIQGFSNWFLLWMNKCTNFTTARSTSRLYTLVPVKGMEAYLSQGGVSTYCTTATVEETNRGQISMYPYDITSDEGTLKVAGTHAQYFQLDLEEDDVVVWYTLGQTDNNYGRYYGQTKKDAANNYYIFSKGNVTYSGAGHSGMGEISELKLFVNTVIRAAVAGNFTPKITILNGSSTRDKDTFVIFPNVMDEKIVVQFTAFDEDLATREVVEHTYDTEAEIREHIGRFKDGKVYWVDSTTGDKKVLYEYSRTGTHLLNGEVTQINIYDPFKGLTGTALTNAYNNASQSMKNMHDCYQAYVTDGLAELLIEASDYQNAKGQSTVKLIQHELFPLD